MKPLKEELDRYITKADIDDLLREVSDGLDFIPESSADPDDARVRALLEATKKRWSDVRILLDSSMAGRIK